MDKDRQKPGDVSLIQVQGLEARRETVFTEWQHFGEPEGEHLVFKAPPNESNRHLDLGHSDHSPEFS
jgi:hypothetical protein